MQRMTSRNSERLLGVSVLIASLTAFFVSPWPNDRIILQQRERSTQEVYSMRIDEGVRSRMQTQFDIRT
jgi:hypothetical protein